MYMHIHIYLNIFIMNTLLFNSGYEKTFKSCYVYAITGKSWELEYNAGESNPI